MNTDEYASQVAVKLRHHACILLADVIDLQVVPGTDPLALTTTSSALEPLCPTAPSLHLILFHYSLAWKSLTEECGSGKPLTPARLFSSQNSINHAEHCAGGFLHPLTRGYYSLLVIKIEIISIHK